MNSSAVSTAWARPGRLVLDDVGDLGAEGRAVAGRLADLVAGLRGDDDPDLLHPGVDQRLDPVEEHGLVGDRDELLRRGVGDRAQARAGAAGEDQSLQWLHARLQPYLLARKSCATRRLHPELQRSPAHRPGAAAACASRAGRSTSSSSTTAPSDDSVALVREQFPEVTLLELERNLGFGPAINRAVREHRADPLILLNNDVECEPRFVEALLDAAAEGVAVGRRRAASRNGRPELIDSAGVVADRTLMGFDYLHGEPLAAAAAAPDPLGPTGGAALYDRDGVRGRRRLRRAHLPLLRGPRPGAADGGRGRPLPPRRRGPGAARLLGQPRRQERPEVRPHRLEPRLHAAPLRGDVATRGRPCGRSPARGRSAPASCCWTAPPRGCAGACGAGATAPACRRRELGGAPLLDISPARRWRCAGGGAAELLAGA